MVRRRFAHRQLKGLKRHLRKRPSCPLLITILAKPFTILISVCINSAMQRKKLSHFDRVHRLLNRILQGSMEGNKGLNCCLSSCAEVFRLSKCKWGTRWSHRKWPCIRGEVDEDEQSCCKDTALCWRRWLPHPYTIHFIYKRSPCDFVTHHVSSDIAQPPSIHHSCLTHYISVLHNTRKEYAENVSATCRQDIAVTTA